MTNPLGRDIPGVTISHCRIMAVDGEWVDTLLTIAADRSITFKNAAILPLPDYDRIARLAFPWWAFWRRKLKRTFGPMP